MTGVEHRTPDTADGGELAPVPGQSRCHLCGSTTVVAVCCSCHRLVCGRHDHKADLADPWRSSNDRTRDRGTPAARQVGAGDQKGESPEVPDQDGAPRAESEQAAEPAEPADPSPEDVRQKRIPKRVAERHFCPACLPRGGPHDEVMQVAVVQVALGGTAAVWNPWIGGLLAVVGATRVGWRLLRGRPRRPVAAVRTLALDPRITTLELTETLTGELRRHEGQSESTVTDVSGVVTIEAVWSRSHTARVADHRKRRSLSATEAVPFSAGSLVVTGPGRLTLPPADGRPPKLVPLRSTTAEHPVLANSGGRGDVRWTHTTDYTVDAPPVGSPSPVWVTVALAPGSGGRALELDVQWCFADPVDGVAKRETAPQAERIDELRLSVPGAWGEVENIRGAEHHATTDVVEGRRQIIWERAKVDASDRGRCPLTVSFQRRILDDQEDVPPVVSGSLRMIFKKSLSGATGVQVHAAGGGRRRDGATRTCVVRTEVELDLDLDLRGLRYQEIRTVPDPVRDGAEPRQEMYRFRGVTPDHKTVARLTDLLSDQGYYVKAVVENPTQTGAGGRRKRVWDVNGRRYNGVHPINFHIGLTGEEIEKEQKGSGRKSTTTVRLNVWGTYANDDMEHDIVAEQAQLWDRIHASVDPTGRVPSELVDTAAAAEVDRLRQAAITVRSELQAAGESGESPDELLSRIIRLVDDEFRQPGGEP
jgi:hypothetical protein